MINHLRSPLPSVSLSSQLRTKVDFGMRNFLFPYLYLLVNKQINKFNND